MGDDQSRRVCSPTACWVLTLSTNTPQRTSKHAKATLERMEQQVEQANMLTDGRGYNPFPTFEPASGLATRRVSAGLRL